MASKTKNVSIIIPMYNEQRYIARCLDSLKHQTYKDFEIILIDDGSKDNTVEIAKWYHKDFDLTILQQKNSGPGKARNRWAKEAKGDIIVLVDADMYFDKEFIKRLVTPILEWKEVGTAHGIEKVGNPENIRAKTRCLNRIPNPPKRSGVYRAIRRDIFLESWGFDSSKGYFDDNLAYINNGKWALTIMNAICYHNNPSTLGEAFKHSTRVGKSLAQTNELSKYLKKYRNMVIAFLFILLAIISIGIYLSISTEYFIYSIILLFVIVLELQAIKRIKKEKERKYIRSFPMLSITRWLGYLYGILRYLFIKR